MIENQAITDRFTAWTEEFAKGPPQALDKGLIHKYNQDNVFVARVERVGDDESDQFICQFLFPPDHPFFFEHPQDHVPGLMMIEAGRQMGNALAHMFYGVGYDKAFVLNKLFADFGSFAELSKPIFGIGVISDKEFKRGALIGAQLEGDFIQGGESIGFMRGRWHFFDRRIMERMRRAAMVGDGSGKPES
ncbi:MAG: hypothetical protein LJE84_01200 [Gammaproteobacteria bacterium]|jgi:hypothetical protein|nr:hypothetical protein [Gammaproteobacteria bacterium]